MQTIALCNQASPFFLQFTFSRKTKLQHEELETSRRTKMYVSVIANIC